MRYFLQLRYKGTNYHGWQIQHNAVSVQQIVNESLSKVLHQAVETTGCGRTDTGVHAEQFYAHFDVSTPLDNTRRLIGKLSSMRIPGVDFQEFFQVHDQAHARFDAISRTYEYRIIRSRNPFLTELAHYVYGPLDVELMNAESKALIGKNDFGAFSKSGTQVKTNICNITEAHWFMCGEQLVFKITADRFLRNMVRAIAGTLIETGQGKRKPENLLRVIESKSRSSAGMSVPACGLFLTEIVYPYTLQKPDESQKPEQSDSKKI